MMNLDDLNGGKTIVKIVGEKIEVDPNAKVSETLKKLLAERGIDSFTILVDGAEITATEDLPETFDDHDIEVQRYTKAG